MPPRCRGRQADRVNAGQQLVAALATLGVGGLMLIAGLAKKRLAWREPGTCRGCGRTLETCSCPQRRG